MGDGGASGGREGRRCGRGVAINLLLLAAVGTTGVRAQQLDGYVELTGERSTQTSEPAPGVTTVTEPTTFFQRYNVNATWTLLPNLRFAAGGLFERTDSLVSEDGEDRDAAQERLRPYVDLALSTPFLSANLALFRLQDRQVTEDFSAREIRDNVNATVTWRPEGLPEWIATFIRTESRDADRELLDSVDTLADLTMEYNPIRNLEIRYRAGVQENKDRIEDLEFRLISHAGRVTYSEALWNRRLLLSGEYNVNYQRAEARTSAGGEVPVVRSPGAGLSADDNFPTTVALAPAPALVDGNRVAPAGTNLGLPPPGGDDSLRNLGLDFTVPTTVDTLRVWVDRTLPPEVSGVFVWEVYTSADNRDWTLEQVAPATFGVLENRFELRFNDVNARYVKVVTAPLRVTDPTADQYPFILVTEVEALDRVPADQAADQPGLTDQRLQANVRTKLLPERNFYYDLSYFGIFPDEGASTFAISHALSYSEQINRVLGISARASWDDGRDSQGEYVSFPYSASVRATWLDTLRQSLVFSGTRTDFEDTSTEFNSVFLQTSADLYRGVSAELGLGTSRSIAQGERSDLDQITASVILLPHPALTLNLLYQFRRTERQATIPVANPERDFAAEEVSMSYRPFAALYFFGSYRLEQEDGTPDRTLREYNIGWNPFPNGSLQISLRYDETFRSELDAESTIASANVRWNLPKGRWVEVSYVQQDVRSILENRESDSVQARLRWPF